MATRTVYPGGSYCEILPSGAFAVLFPGQYQRHADGSVTVLDPGRILTHLGDIALPAQEVSSGGVGPLQLRITDIGEFQMAGKPNNALGTWLWTESSGVWTLDPRNGAGYSVQIFDATGALQVISGPLSPNGYRYVSDAGALILGVDTYTDPARNLAEYSEYDCGPTHVAIGQGLSGGGLVAVTGVPGSSTLRRFTLETGDRRWVRFSHSGTSLAVATVSPTGAILRTLDVSDLVAGGTIVAGGGGVAVDCGG